MTWLVRNCTPDRLLLVGPHRRVELAPLEHASFDQDPASVFPEACAQAADERALQWEEQPVRSVRERVAAALTITAVALAVLGAVVATLAGPVAGGLLGAAAILCLAGVLSVVRGGPDGAWTAVRGVWLATVDIAVLGGIVLAGIVLPLFAVYYGSDLTYYLAFDGLRPQVAEGDEVVVAGRALQVLLIIVLTLLPGMMFFQFDSEKGGTLVGRWLHTTFRFDPTLRTLADVDAKYGKRVEESYGVSLLGGQVQGLRRRARSPIGVTTVLLALGWTLVLANGDGNSSGSGDELEQSIADLFVPSATPLAYAFLGAYFYALGVVLRGFVRGDLRPKTYSAITVRVVSSIVLAWVAQGFGVPLLLALPLAFFAGIVPDTVLRRLRDSSRLGRDRWEGLTEPRPLTRLDGIDLYERTRLAEEGITNVQALAHHDVVDLILSTRIPAHRVVDWVDQAVLHQHTSDDDRVLLRGAGIRSLTDLLAVAESPCRSDLEGLLPPERLRMLLRAVEDDEWVVSLRAWRAWDLTGPRPQRVYPHPVVVDVTDPVPAQSARPTRGPAVPAS